MTHPGNFPAVLRLGIALLAAAAVAGAARGDDLIVTTANDVVNGDVSSPAALGAAPGPDGISLREALTAADGAAGPTAITIDPSLSGRTIALTSDLPPVTREGISILGPVDASGRALVTVSGSPISVFASHFRAAGLRLIGSRGAVFYVFAGRPDAPGSATVSDVRIEDDVFEGGGAVDVGHAVSIGTAEESSGARVEGVTIARNSFLDFGGDVAAVLCEAGGTAGAVGEVAVDGNTFRGNAIGVRIGVEGGGNRVSGVAVTGNDFFDNGIAVAAISGARPDRPPSTDGVVEGILLARNRIRGGDAAAIYFLAGGSGATGLVVRDVDIVDDVVWGERGFAVGGEAGSGTGSTGNRIENVRIVNDTMASGAGRSGVAFYADSYGAGGNSVSGIEIANTIFAGDGAAFAGDAVPSLVTHSILRDPSFVGRDGNFSGDPAFIDPARGDFHLRAGSGAIGRGLASAAPCVDADGRARRADGSVDVGAYEFEAPLRARPCPISAAIPAVPARGASR